MYSYIYTVYTIYMQYIYIYILQTRSNLKIYFLKFFMDIIVLNLTHCDMRKEPDSSKDNNEYKLLN